MTSAIYSGDSYVCSKCHTKIEMQDELDFSLYITTIQYVMHKVKRVRGANVYANVIAETNELDGGILFYTEKLSYFLPPGKSINE